MDLYYSPLSCSLAVRVVAHEAGVPLGLHQVEVFARTLTDGGGRYTDVAPFGLVPALRLDDGSVLTEVAAIVQYVADLQPAAGLAPPAGTRARSRLVEWLSFVGAEVHKQVVWPQFNAVPEPVRAHARALAPAVFDHVARHLTDRAFLVGDRFTAADAYLTWALHLARLARLDPGAGRPPLAAYLDRQLARASFAELLADETPRVTRR
jgi:glutathione S-transferase